MTVQITRWGLVGLLALVIAWDIYTFINDIPGDTVTEVVSRVFRDFPALATALGIVLGHLTLRASRPAQWQLVVCASAFVVIMVTLLHIPAAISLPMGILTGWVAWPHQ